MTITNDTNSTVEIVLLSVPQAARLLTISRRQYYKLAARGELPRPAKICGVSRVAKRDIDAVIARTFAKVS